MAYERNMNRTENEPSWTIYEYILVTRVVHVANAGKADLPPITLESPLLLPLSMYATALNKSTNNSHPKAWQEFSHLLLMLMLILTSEPQFFARFRSENNLWC